LRRLFLADAAHADYPRIERDGAALKVRADEPAQPSTTPRPRSGRPNGKSRMVKPDCGASSGNIAHAH
jgi:hypothetical protein